ncbi:hypothetical protein DPEC_G00117050 [Dallia pectoralis]|uniref:Uncharacterized protein n=1 Tax=Dallia pectoralis TaxID=75939 RepID=A0ACC2GUC2_DALPE|nr:hypothetical protein DPEC_G00117050 [Dallia pectoralis]
MRGRCVAGSALFLSGVVERGQVSGAGRSTKEMEEDPVFNIERGNTGERGPWQMEDRRGRRGRGTPPIMTVTGPSRLKVAAKRLRDSEGTPEMLTAPGPATTQSTTCTVTVLCQRRPGWPTDPICPAHTRSYVFFVDVRQSGQHHNPSVSSVSSTLQPSRSQGLIYTPNGGPFPQKYTSLRHSSTVVPYLWN